jgi:hypothetical protein
MRALPYPARLVQRGWVVTNATGVTVAPNTPKSAEKRRSILSFLSSMVSMVVVAWCKKAGLLQMQRVLRLHHLHQKKNGFFPFFTENKE